LQVIDSHYSRKWHGIIDLSRRSPFVALHGIVECQVSFHFDECGNAKIIMQVTRFEAEQHLDIDLHQLLSGPPVIRKEGSLVMGIGASNSNHCTTLFVTTDRGTLSVLDKELHYSYPEIDEGIIQFHPAWVLFTSLNQVKAAYWVVPLLDFLSDFRQTNPDLNQHPLRIFPTPIVPDVLEGEDRLNPRQPTISMQCVWYSVHTRTQRRWLQ